VTVMSKHSDPLRRTTINSLESNAPSGPSLFEFLRYAVIEYAGPWDSMRGLLRAILSIRDRRNHGPRLESKAGEIV